MMMMMMMMVMYCMIYIGAGFALSVGRDLTSVREWLRMLNNEHDLILAIPGLLAGAGRLNILLYRVRVGGLGL